MSLKETSNRLKKSRRPMRLESTSKSRGTPKVMERRWSATLTQSRCRLIETVLPPLVVTARRLALILRSPKRLASETVRMR